MTTEQEILQNALLLSYLHSKMCIKNMEVVLHQLTVTHHELKGKVQHRFEKLINAHRNAMTVIERNIENKELLEADIESQIDANWKTIQEV